MYPTQRDHARQTRQQSRSREGLEHRAQSATRTAPAASRKPVGKGSSSADTQHKHSGTSAAEKTEKKEKMGLVAMYKEAPPGDGEMLATVVKEGWKMWNEKRKRDEAATMTSASRMAESEKSRSTRNPPVSASDSRSSPRSSSHRHESRPRVRRADASLYQRTATSAARERDSAKSDDLDVLVSRVTDKLSGWGKEISEAKSRKTEERQRREREALKKTISQPKLFDAGSGTQRLDSPHSSTESAKEIDAKKTGGSMADRMAKRNSGSSRVPFWPRGKKETKEESSNKGSPGSRVTQMGDFMLASAPWNQHVTKSSPFTPPHSSSSSQYSSGRSSTDSAGSRSGSPSAKFFSKFVPSPAPLFGAGGLAHSSKAQRRGSDDSFFGCQGISVEQEAEAQHVVRRGGNLNDSDSVTVSNDSCPPSTPRDDAREPFGGKARGPGHSGSRGGRRDDDSDGGGDGRQPRRLPAGARGPRVRNAQHRPEVLDAATERRSVAADVVDGRQRRGGGSGSGEHEVGGDDNRVSWWDPPLPLPPRSKKGKQRAEGREELGAERMEYWKKYRKDLGRPGPGREEGKPF